MLTLNETDSGRILRKIGKDDSGTRVAEEWRDSRSHSLEDVTAIYDFWLMDARCFLAPRGATVHHLRERAGRVNPLQF